MFRFIRFDPRPLAVRRAIRDSESRMEKSKACAGSQPKVSGPVASLLSVNGTPAFAIDPESHRPRDGDQLFLP